MTEPRLSSLIEVTEQLTDEELSSYVDWLRVHMKDRANRRNAKAKALIKVGDRVRLAGNYKPQYLNGQTGVVVEKKQTRVLVKLDCGPLKKFRSGQVLTTPSGLEVITNG